MVVAAAAVAKAQDKHPLTVEDLFGLVEKNSKSLRAEKTGVQFADLGVASAKTKRLPDIQTSLSVAYNGNVLVTNREFGDVHGYHAPHFGNSFALEAQQVIYAGGAIDASVRMAELQHWQATTSEQLTRQQQRFLALGQYLDLYKVDNRMQVYRKNIELTARLIDNIRAKHEQGMALQNDITRYELQMETLRLGLRKLQDTRAILNHQLCNTLGLTDVEIVPDTILTMNLETDMSRLSQSDWLQQAIANSPQMEQAKIAMQMAQAEEQLARSEMLPKVALFAADNLNGPFTSDIPPKNINVNYWYVGVGVKYPISSLFKNNKRVKQAVVAVHRSEEAHAVTAEQLDNRVQQAWTLFQQSFVELQTQQKSVQLASQNYQVMNDRYLSQLALVTDMVDASNLRLNAELQEVDARINILYAFYQLKYTAGVI